jgi:hypothetical protein
VLASALIALVLLAQTGPGHSLMRAAGLTTPAQAYTALSFTDPGGLIANLPSGHIAVTAPFTIANNSATTSTYRWSLLLVRGGATLRTTTGQTTVAPGGSAQVSPEAQALCPSGRLKVVVRLAEPAQAIDFWADCGGTNTGGGANGA